MKVENYKMISLEHYTEGPAMDKEGNVYCTTLNGGNILKIDRDEKYTIWGRSACPNGQIILSNGDHLFCDSQQSSILRYNSQGSFLRNEIFQSCNGKKVFVPNDLIADRTDGIYFTDSIRKEGKVGYRSNTGKEYIVAMGLDYPNGLALSSDERVLFVAESYKNRIIAIKLECPGIAAGEIEVIAELPRHSSGKAAFNLPDGIALDSNNQLWIAHYGMQAVQVINMDGELINSIRMPFPLVSNVFFSTINYLEAIVTGGYDEPGPGAICRLTMK